MIKVYVSSGKSEATLEGINFLLMPRMKKPLCELIYSWIASAPARLASLFRWRTLRRSFRLLKSLSAQLSDKVEDFKGAPRCVIKMIEAG